MSRARHRRPAARPITAPITLAAAITSGSLAMVAAPAAQASPSVDWDRVAACESSGNWAANTGNGFTGGLQFTASTWHAYGGSGSPQNASRSEQIAVAERVLAGQGIGAWPVCGPRGLGGTTHTTGPTHQAVPTHTTPHAAPRSTHTAPHATTAPTHQGTPRQAPVTPPHQPASPPRHRPTSDPARYTIQAGDTLSEIAGSHQVTGGVPALAHANAITDVDLIFPGRVLTLPARAATAPLTAPTPRHAAPPVTGSAAPPLTTVQPTTRPTSHSVDASPSSIVATARTFIGTPFRWGGTTRAGMDCSGLVQAVYRANGVILPRTAAAQMAAARRITRAEARPGDLVGAADGSHIGVYLGGNEMIDSPTDGQFVGVHRLYSEMTIFGRVG